jgi:hypothetical protein
LPELLADDDLAHGIDTVELKNVLGEIKTNGASGHRGWLPRALDATFPTLSTISGAEDRFANGFAVEQRGICGDRRVRVSP